MKNTLVAFAALMFVMAASALAADSPQIAMPVAPSIPAPAAEQAAPIKDPIESLNDAIKAYQTGKYNEALDAITEARKGVGAKHLAVYQTLLPSAPGAGWTSTDKPDLILMSGVTREYTANGQTVSIAYTIDPGMVKMLSDSNKMVNALFSGGNDASGKNDNPITVKGHRAAYQEMKLGDKILMYKLTVYDDDVLVTIQSNTIGKDTLMKFAELVDYDKLKTAH